MNGSKDEEYLKGIQETYDILASEWDRLRSSSSKEWKGIGTVVHDGMRILDVGCGNGRALEALGSKRITYDGIDVSGAMIERARNKYRGRSEARFHVADMNSLPFAGNAFDLILCFAAFHHLPSEEIQFNALEEMARVAKPGARLVMGNWNLRQWNTILQYRLFHLLFSRKSDCVIPWRAPGRIVLRAYHSFTLSELSRLFRNSPWRIDTLEYRTEEQKRHWWNGRNSVVIATRR